MFRFRKFSLSLSRNYCSLTPKKSYVSEKFKVSPSTEEKIRKLTPNFGFDGFGEAVFYRTYSRQIPDEKNPSTTRQENWADVVLRVTSGIFSIRKTHYVKNRLAWNDDHHQDFAEKLAVSMFKMHWLPPGRGLWACGTDFVAERGSAALNNCVRSTTKDFVLGVCFTLDMLMNGCGVGSDVSWDGKAQEPKKGILQTYFIEDSREGWVNSVRVLLEAYIPNGLGNTGSFPKFDYSLIRPAGSIIKGFGGTASGPGPLKDLHTRIEAYLDAYLEYEKISDSERSLSHIKEKVFVFTNLMQKLRKVDYGHLNDKEFSNFLRRVSDTVIEYPYLKKYDKTRCAADIINALGVCVVAGNVRRSSELLLGEPEDETFKNLKNYSLNPERQSIGWMSNNSIRLSKTEHFSNLPQLAERIRDNGEPGIFNQLNITRYGRVRNFHGDKEISLSREREPDRATGCNPCSEIPLEDLELCNLGEVFPTRCLQEHDGLFANNKNLENYIKALEFATFYTSTVALLSTHWEQSNAIISRNRRIGVSLSGVADLYDLIGATELTRILRLGYKKVREINSRLAEEAGVPSSIRVSTIKPSGCQTAETLVVSSDGILELGEIGNINGPTCQKINMDVSALEENTYENSSGFFVNGRKKIRVITMDSGVKLKCTYNHKYRILRDGEIHWIEVRNIKPGDLLPYHVGDYIGVAPKEYQKLVNNLKKRRDARYKSFDPPEYLNEDIAWFLGLYLGDGSNHRNGIRIAGNIKDTDILEKAADIIEKNFIGLDGKIYERTKSENNADLYVNSTDLVKWLKHNGLKKGHSHEIEIPLLIRKSPVSVIEAYIDGYWNADGCTHQQSGTRTFVTVSKKMAQQLVIVMRAIGQDASVRLMPPTKSSWGKRMRYWIAERKGRKGQWRNSTRGKYFKQLNELGMDHLYVDIVKTIKTSTAETYDISVPVGHTYTANSFVSHNSISQLAGVSSGMHFPTFRYAIRRMRVSENTPIVPILKAAGYPCQRDFYEKTNTLVFEFPICQGSTRSAKEVPLWEQASLLATLQREYADNMVSVTLYFNPEKEGNQIEHVLGHFAPQIKSASLLPHSSKGVYKQAPYEEITKEEYEQMKSKLKPIDWKQFGNSDGEIPKFCNNDVCEIAVDKNKE